MAFPPYTVAKMPHGAQPNLVLFLMRHDIVETFKFADATLVPSQRANLSGALLRKVILARLY
jgi:hypothetical protein